MDPDEIAQSVLSGYGGSTPGGGESAPGLDFGFLSRDQLDVLIAKHGGLAGITAVDPQLKGTNQTNPNPTYRYVFHDGTSLLGTTAADLDKSTNQWIVKGLNVAGPSTALAPEKSTKPTMTPPGSLDTTEQYYAVWNPDTGDYERRLNPLFDPTAAASRKALDEARLAQAQRLAAGGRADNSVAWANLAQRRSEFEAEQALKREQMRKAWDQAQADIAATNERNRLNQTVGFTNDLLARWATAAPSAMIPGQSQFLGFEPGGPYEQLVKMGGGTYNPGLYKPAPVTLDPGAAWRAAQAMIAGGR